MAAIFASWGISFVVLLTIAVVLGSAMRPPRVPWGILIDARGRYSLTHFHLVVWSIVILSLISGVFFGRLFDGVNNPLEFTIPSQVLGLLGISVGTAVATTSVKATKDATVASRIAASGPEDPPRLAQIFLLEEGQYADQVIDITKYQTFVFTILLVVAYIALSIHTIHHDKNPAAVKSLPTFSGTFLILVGISQAGYVGGKIPNRAGTPSGLTVADQGVLPLHTAPRNPNGILAATVLGADRRTNISNCAREISQSPDAGSDMSNWLHAEKEIDAELRAIEQRARAIAKQADVGGVRDISLRAVQELREEGRLTFWRT